MGGNVFKVRLKIKASEHEGNFGENPKPSDECYTEKNSSSFHGLVCGFCLTVAASLRNGQLLALLSLRRSTQLGIEIRTEEALFIASVEFMFAWFVDKFSCNRVRVC